MIVLLFFMRVYSHQNIQPVFSMIFLNFYHFTYNSVQQVNAGTLVATHVFCKTISSYQMLNLSMGQKASRN